MQGPMTASEARGMQGIAGTPPIKDRLVNRRRQLTLELDKVEGLLKLLKENPSIENFVDLMGGIQY